MVDISGLVAGVAAYFSPPLALVCRAGLRAKATSANETRCFFKLQSLFANQQTGFFFKPLCMAKTYKKGIFKAMSTKYKFSDQDQLYFVSFAVVNWMDAG